MSSSIAIQFTAEDAALIASYRKQIRELEKQVRKLEQAGRTGERASRKIQGGFAKAGQTLVGMLGTYASISVAVGIWKQANQEIIQQSEEINRKYDEINRKLRVQGGLTAIQTDSAKDRILNIAEITATPGEQAYDAATQLISSGASNEVATGGGLLSFLKILKAANQTGQEVDSAQLAQALVGFVQSQGQEASTENLTRAGVAVQRLFRGTNVQLSALPELAKEGGTLSSAFDQEEQLSAFAILLKSFDKGTAAVALRNITNRLQTAEVGRTQKKGLDVLGLQPTDTDFVGESLQDVLQILDTRLNQIPEEQRAGVLKNLVGESAVAPLSTLIRDRGKIPEYNELQRDAAGFEADVAIATSGRNAAEIRQRNRLERRRLQVDDQGDLLRQELSALDEDAGVSPFRRVVRSTLFDTLRWFGVSPESAAASVYGGPFSDDPSQFVRDRVGDRTGGANDQAEAIGQLRDQLGQIGQNPDVALDTTRILQRRDGDRQERVAEDTLKVLERIERKLPNGQQPPRQVPQNPSLTQPMETPRTPSQLPPPRETVPPSAALSNDSSN